MADANNLNIINAMRAFMPLDYQSMIPVATQENLNDIYNNILNIEPVRNSFCSSLVNRIMAVTIHDMVFKNPLRGVKSATAPYGYTEQEIFVNMANAVDFNPFAGYEEAFAFYESNVMAAYHKINYQRQFPVTITFDNLRSAFTDAYGIRSLIQAKVNSLYNRANWEEYLITKQLIINAYNQQLVYNVYTNEVQDEASAKAALVNVKTYAGMVQFPNPKFNLAGASSFSLPEDMVWITTPGTNAQFDVDALAYAFHMERAQIDLQTIIVDDFGDTPIIGAMVDRRWFRIRDQFRTFTEQYNAASLNHNFFYTVSEMFSISPFMPCIVFSDKQNSATAITLTAPTTYNPSDVVELSATVTGTAGTYIPQSVGYELSGNTDRATGIVPGTSTLMVGAKETGTLTVKATSGYASSVTASKTITKATA